MDSLKRMQAMFLSMMKFSQGKGLEQKVGDIIQQGMQSTKDYYDSNIRLDSEWKLENWADTNDKDCRFCGKTYSENWSPSNVIKKDYKCRLCFNIVSRQYYLRRRAKTLTQKQSKHSNRIKKRHLCYFNPAWAGWIKLNGCR